MLICAVVWSSIQYGTKIIVNIGSKPFIRCEIIQCRKKKSKTKEESDWITHSRSEMSDSQIGGIQICWFL